MLNLADGDPEARAAPARGAARRSLAAADAPVAPSQVNAEEDVTYEQARPGADIQVRARRCVRLRGRRAGRPRGAERPERAR